MWPSVWLAEDCWFVLVSRCWSRPEGFSWVVSCPWRSWDVFKSCDLNSTCSEFRSQLNINIQTILFIWGLLTCARQKQKKPLQKPPHTHTYTHSLSHVYKKPVAAAFTAVTDHTYRPVLYLRTVSRITVTFTPQVSLWRFSKGESAGEEVCEESLKNVFGVFEGIMKRFLSSRLLEGYFYGISWRDFNYQSISILGSVMELLVVPRF